MAASEKCILTMGLGRFATFDANAAAKFGPDASATAQRLLRTSIEKANAAGFDVVACDVNPEDPEDTMKRMVDALGRSNFVGANIGYGVRGHKEHTALLERIINTLWEVRPGIKIMFSNGPDEVITAIQRSFPDAFQ